MRTDVRYAHNLNCPIEREHKRFFDFNRENFYDMKFTLGKISNGSFVPVERQEFIDYVNAPIEQQT